MSRLKQATSTTPLVQAAKSYLACGLSVLPAARDGDKKRVSLQSWKEYQTRLPTIDEWESWERNNPHSICIVCGGISGNLEVLDFDMRGELFSRWCEQVKQEYPGLLERLFIQRTPSGGFHAVYRCDATISGSHKLAQRQIPTESEDEVIIAGKPYRPRQNAAGEWAVTLTLIETRGEGSVFLCSPSDGYEAGQGDLRDLPVLTDEERVILLSCARDLSEVETKVINGPSVRTKSNNGQPRPGDDYNGRGDIRPILQKNGWRLVRPGENEHWCRPGKDAGTSATLKGGVFYNFSSNADPFESDRGYSLFAVYTLLQHHGDFSAAARALADEGYGLDHHGSRPRRVGDCAGDSGNDTSDGRPRILISTEEHVTIEQTIEAVARDPDLYCRGNMLVRTLRTISETGKIKRAPGTSIITEVPPANLRERMTRWARFYKLEHKGGCWVERRAHPAAWLVSGVDQRGEWPGIRPLLGISEFPFLRPDGTMCLQPGYDESTGVLLLPTVTIARIPESISRTHAQSAVEALSEVVCDFPFASDADRATWLAGLLTLLSRYAFTGPAPLFLIDANVRGLGKTLLSQTFGLITYGRKLAVCSYSHDSDEMRKIITSVVMAGDQCVLLDNVVGTLGNAALDRALTAEQWMDRVLGINKTVNLPIRTVWFATGNNITVKEDTARRCVHMRLDLLEERPEQRTGFLHPNLSDWILDHRPDLLAHGLTILAGYWQAESPDMGLAALGGFEGWSGLPRSAVVWAGLPDPCDTGSRLIATADTSADALSQLVAAWRDFDPDRHGWTIGDLINHLYPPAGGQPPTEHNDIAMRVAIENFVGCPANRTPSARSLGRKLGSVKRRVKDGMYFDTDPNAPKRKGAVWLLCSSAVTSCA